MTSVYECDHCGLCCRRLMVEATSLDVVDAKDPAAAAAQWGKPVVSRPPRETADVARLRQISASLKAAFKPDATAASDAPVADGVTRPRQKILDAIAWFEVMGIRSPSRSNVAAIAGVSPVSSGFEKNVSTLRARHGAVDFPGPGLLALTDAGRAVANRPAAPPTVDAIHRAWLTGPALSGPQSHLLGLLIEIHPESVTRERLAELAGVSAISSGFEKNVSRLSSLSLVTYPAAGQVRANPELLFPEGAR